MLDCDFIWNFAYSTKNWKLHEKGAISQTNCLSYLKPGYSLSDGIPYQFEGSGMEWMREKRIKKVKSLDLG